MPARRFFTILESSRKAERIRYAYEMADLCDVAAIAICNGQYADDLRKSFISRGTGKPWRRNNTVKMTDARDPQAANVLGAIFKAKAKLEGLNG
jgi:hypothetical protein